VQLTTVYELHYHLGCVAAGLVVVAATSDGTAKSQLSKRKQQTKALFNNNLNCRCSQ